MGEGDVDFDGIFETLRGIFANKQLKKDAPKVGGIILRILFGFPEKMNIKHQKLVNVLNVNY